MKFKLNLILLIAHLLLASALLGKIQLVGLALSLALYAFDDILPSRMRNLAYFALALSPVPVLFMLFLLYLPFSFFGHFLGEDNFIKRYLLGYCAAILVTLLIYCATLVAPITLSQMSVALLVMVGPLLMGAWLLWKKKIISQLGIPTLEYRMMLALLLPLFFVFVPLLTTHSLFSSNGTHFYSKFAFIPQSIAQDGEFPFYAPQTAQGEILYMSDSPGMYAHLGLMQAGFPFFHPVLFYNGIQVFVVLLTLFGAIALFRSLYSGEIHESGLAIAMAIGAFGLSFVMVQYLESFKQFFDHPVSLLTLALIAAGIFDMRTLALVGALFGLSLAIHPAQTVGMLLLGGIFFLVLQAHEQSLFRRVRSNWKVLINDKLALAALGLVVMLPLFYVIPNIHYGEYMRGSDSHVPFSKILSESDDYLKAFFLSSQPLSLHNPNPSRNDEKIIGPVFTILGIMGLLFALFNVSNRNFLKLHLFLLAFALKILASAFIVTMPIVRNLEYAHRTIIPFTLLALCFCVAACVLAIRNNALRWSISALLVAALLFTLPLVRENAEGVHTESVIGGESYRYELELLSKLPKDGRIMTYGHFSNAVDAALASLSGHYLARYEFKQLDNTRTVYEKIHDTDSWGSEQIINRISTQNLSNHLAWGGYRYVLLGCHQISAAVAEKLYPTFSILIYQNPSINCFAMLMMNDTYYAEKVNVVSLAEEQEREEKPLGNLYVSINEKHTPLGQNRRGEGAVTITSPAPVQFTRDSWREVRLLGDFKEGEWVVFKERYFPTWKAFMGGEEITLYSTNHDMMLVQTKQGSEITLINAPSDIMRITAAISAIAIFMLIVILFGLGRLEEKEENEGHVVRSL